MVPYSKFCCLKIIVGVVSGQEPQLHLQDLRSQLLKKLSPLQLIRHLNLQAQGMERFFNSALNFNGSVDDQLPTDPSDLTCLGSQSSPGVKVVGISSNAL